VDKVLGIFQERAGINTPTLAVFTYVIVTVLFLPFVFAGSNIRLEKWRRLCESFSWAYQANRIAKIEVILRFRLFFISVYGQIERG
jgi:hypothetical protein